MTHNRKAEISAAIETAKKNIRSIITNFRKKGIGYTTAEDDISIITKIFVVLEQGLEVAMDPEVDANPVMVLRSFNWNEFVKDFPNTSFYELVEDIRDKERKKLIELKDIKNQVRACFMIAHEALMKALSPLAHQWVDEVAFDNGTIGGITR